MTLGLSKFGPMYANSRSAQDNDGEVVLHSELPEWSWKEAGAPQSIRTVIRSPADDPSLYLDISLILKTATRLPEVSHRTNYNGSCRSSEYCKSENYVVREHWDRIKTITRPEGIYIRQFVPGGNRKEVPKK